MDHSQEHRHGTEPPANRGRWVLIGFLLIGGFFMFTEHRAHLLGILPYLLLLACPLMHLFHHGHGHHGDHDRNPVAKDANQTRESEKS